MRTAFALVVALFVACKSAPPPTVASPPPQPEPAQPPEPRPQPDLFTQSKADVERLRAEANTDPLLAPWTGAFGGAPPWDKVKASAIPAVFEKGIVLRRAEIRAIANDPAPPTFANTFVPYEDAGRHLGRARTLFSVLVSSLNTPDVQAVDKEWSPKLAAADDEIKFDAKLFARFEAVHAAREALTPPQRRLVELTYDAFVRGGAKLTPEQKTQMGRINQELSSAFTEFGNRVLKDEDTWVVLQSEKDLVGLSPSMIASYEAAAKERKLEAKWVVTNTRSSVDPFLTTSTRRDLREKVWKAFKGRGDNGGATDTNELIVKIVKLRNERAALLGYPTHAHLRMANTMAKDPAKADELMVSVWPAAAARVKEEVADMQKVAKREGAKITIEPWDYLFYAEKVRKQKYALNQDELKPYFELNNMIAASFYMAEQLYDLTFVEITGKVSVFQPDVRVWEVRDKSTNAFRGLFYGDYFARANKRSGAWASTYRGHETFNGKVTVVTSNNNNFVKGRDGEPVLISLDDAETLFHEFGHGLHGLLSEVEYPGLATTPRDFVEYPSQVHEMWVMSKPILEKYALHYQTKKPMPAALIKKVAAAETFNQGYVTVEYLLSSILDMRLHTAKDPVADPKAFERDQLALLKAPKEIALRHRLPQFLHLFSSDSYSAGYYSYLWSETMDADTREAFVSTGNVFDPATAKGMRTHILAPGNTTDRTEAYRAFRGRDPDVRALFRKRGFPVKK
jgi:peptidyl-dipeptidase Dcp